MTQGIEADLARRRASFRVFGSKPGAYGAGLQALIDERGWESEADLARAYVAWGGYAYGGSDEGVAEHRLFEQRLAAIELVLHNQDNREHDILDSDDYYQFEGGIAAAVRHLSGEQPEIYHNDHSRPETPRIGTLKEEIGRIVRAPRGQPQVAERRDAPWLQGRIRDRRDGRLPVRLRRHGAGGRGPPLRGALRGLCPRRSGARLHRGGQPGGPREIAERFQEAIERGLWRPASNSAYRDLAALPRQLSLRSLCEK